MNAPLLELRAPARSLTWLRSAGGWTFVGGVIFSALAFGSVDPLTTNAEVILFAGLALAFGWAPFESTSLARLHAVALILLALLLAYLIWQAKAPAPAWANPAWTFLRSWLPEARATVSAAPGMTLGALSPLALPFFVFLSALSIAQRHGEAEILWRRLAHFGAVYAAFALFQEAFFPGQLMFSAKTHYMGAVTGSFVNRNTAGTFLGLALLLNLSLLLKALRRIDFDKWLWGSLASALPAGEKPGTLALRSLTVLMVAVALFLTQSRGAIVSSFVAVLLAVALTAFPVAAAPARGAAWRRAAALGGGLLLVVALFSLFGERAAYRLQEADGQDGRWCSFGSTLQAISATPWLGSGFGAFQDVYPAFRTAACAGINGVWERAHNGFLEGYLGLGAPFLAVLAVVYGALGQALITGLRQRSRLRFVPVATLAALTLVTLHSVVDFSLQIPGCAVYFAAIAGCGAAVSLQKR